MKLFGYYVDLTFGPLFTVIVGPIIVWAICKILGRIMNRLDKASEERHQNVLTAIKENREAFTKKMDDHCARQELLHNQIDKRFWKHHHDENGDIVIKGGM